MAEVRTVYCDVPGCKEQFQEMVYGQGFPGWGAIQGIQNRETGTVQFMLCPECLNRVKKFVLKKED